MTGTRPGFTKSLRATTTDSSTQNLHPKTTMKSLLKAHQLRNIATATTLCLGGCAATTVTRVRPSDMDTPGVRYWLPTPYLAVTAPVLVYESKILFQLEEKAGMSSRLTRVCVDECSPPSDTPPEDSQPSPDPAAASAKPSIPNKSKKPSPVPNKAGVPSWGTIPGQQSGGTSGSSGDAASKNAKPDKPDKPATPPPNSVSVVWLPDHCEQYAVDFSSDSAINKSKIVLADGWKLSELDVDVDNTTIGTKALDTIATIAEAVAGALAPGSGSGSDDDDSANDPGSTDDGAQSGSRKYVLKTTKVYLQPGVYPLFTRASCTSAPAFNNKVFKQALSKPRESWKTIDF